MRLPHRRFLYLAGVAAAVAILSVTVTGHGAWSQTARTIKVVVPVQPGGGIDFLARVLGEEIGRAQGPTMVIENRPGAGSIIGAEAVSHAAPDGNTLLITTSTVVINAHLRKVNYDPLTSFEPICYLVNAPTPAETVVLEPGERWPDYEGWNNQLPRSEWVKGFNGQEGPWKPSQIAYFLDPKSMAEYHWVDNTTGGGIAIREAIDSIKAMRRFRPGAAPIVELATKHMPTAYGGRERPHFVIHSWVTMPGEEPPPAALPGHPRHRGGRQDASLRSTLRRRSCPSSRRRSGRR